MGEKHDKRPGDGLATTPANPSPTDATFVVPLTVSVSIGAAVKHGSAGGSGSREHSATTESAAPRPTQNAFASIVYIIHHPQDRGFVEGSLVPLLSRSGFDDWISSTSTAGDSATPAAEALRECQVVLAVLSQVAVASADFNRQVELGLASRPLLIFVRAKAFGEWAPRGQTSPEPLLDFELESTQAMLDLAELLPPAKPRPVNQSIAALLTAVGWNEQLFSESLAVAVERHNYGRAEAQVEIFARHARRTTFPYPGAQAAGDLKLLQRERYFKLMIRFGDAVLQTGTREEEVRRRLGQALIEEGEYERALEILNSIVRDPASQAFEVTEARGLIGRIFKQIYVDDPEHAGRKSLLRAIRAYETVYKKDSTFLWHGINAASCILRARRDGIEDVDPKRATQIATEVLAEIERRAKSGSLDLWDCATRVEALLALGRYGSAEEALADYLQHPDLKAFEVSSTHRQFEQVLQLGQDPKGKAILEQLRAAVERYRAPGLSHRDAPPEQKLGVVIRLTHPEWQPQPGLGVDVQGRLGTIVTAEMPQASLDDLLRDPQVISVSESRPCGELDCDRSIPFVGVAAEYAAAAGPYVEKGDAALIAVIDGGIDVLHEAFLDAQGRSRIEAIWDQKDTTGPPPDGFTRGTYHSAADIARYVASGQVEKALGRDSVQQRKGHGTHVASIAAGRACGAFAGGVSPESRLVVVIPVADGPVGYSRSYVESLTFIDRTATRLGLPVVVNVSQGMNAGAHDGKSELEVAFDDFSGGGRTPGRIVVKSAGNERDKSAHAMFTVRPNAREDLPWTRPTDASSPVEWIELWWELADQFRFSLISPGGVASAEVSVAQPEANGSLDGCAYSMVLTWNHIDNGDNQLRIRLGSDQSPATAGNWKLRVLGEQVDKEGKIHAWIERGVGGPTQFTKHVNEETTLSIPGTAQSVIAVAAIEMGDFIAVGTFSSYGRTRDGREKPDLAAPGLAIRAASGGTANDVTALSGTSQAAPHVAGAIALVLSRAKKQGRQIPASSQVQKVLWKSCRNGNNRFDPGLGYGVLDVKAFLKAYN